MMDEVMLGETVVVGGYFTAFSCPRFRTACRNCISLLKGAYGWNSEFGMHLHLPSQ